MGLALGELSSLVTEAAYYHARRNTMDDKLRDVMTSTLAAAGMWVVWLGVTDASTWMSWSGAIMMVLSVVLPFVMPKKA